MTSKPKSGLKSLGHPAVKPTTRKNVRRQVRELIVSKHPSLAGKSLHDIAVSKPKYVIEAYEAVGYKAPYRFLEVAGMTTRYKAA